MIDSVETVNRRLFLQAYTLAQATGTVVEREVQSFGLPTYLFGLLSQIRELAPVAPSRISATTGTPMTTLRDNIQRLVDRGLIRRKPNPADGRSYLVELTPRGELLARAAGEPLLRAYLALEERLPRPLEEYQRVLDELTQAVQGVLAEVPAEIVAEA
jgi:DNA-binding MarR family transcriptional regulator